MKHAPVIEKQIHHGIGHGCVSRMKKPRVGESMGDRIKAVIQKLSFRLSFVNLNGLQKVGMRTYPRSWKKNKSLIYICPPASATTRKKPWRIRAAMNESKDGALAHQAVVTNPMRRNQKRTGKRPKYDDRVTANSPPIPSIKTLPAWE